MAKSIVKNSVFNYSYSKRYYLTHPWQWIKEFFQNCYHGWRRAIYGWTWEDCWNFNSWFCIVVPQLLNYLADYGCAYPGEPFETPEKWHDWLHSVADVIETFNDEEFWYTTKNEFVEEWDKVSEEARVEGIDDLGYKIVKYEENDHYKEIKKLYFTRMEEISKERQALIENTFHELGTHFDCLWD